MEHKTTDIADMDEATDVFVSIFPDARLMDVLDHAERAERNLTAWGRLHEAEIMREVASIIRRRLAN